LVVLSYAPPGAARTLAWVGKGIVYDTGGLSLKTKEGMPGMKGDMGGAAAVLGAFAAAVRLGVPARIHALLCVAENAIGPAAIRPDDIITLYSGRTVEINNTDAEGRLVLGDGVAWAVKHLRPDVLVDLATLTGAQLVATGKRHAGVVCNDEELEAAAVRAGRASGDLVHPLPYVPEFFRREFKSDVADLKNSVKDRSNAQSSCAAQFIAEHLGGYDGPWLHVDLAGPSANGERGTGFGVALLLTLFAEG
jgi:probable aminopeptidase NPEPL1